MKFSEQFKIYFPEITRERIETAGFAVKETKDPRLLLDDDCLFLGEVPKRSDFEKGIPVAYFLEDGIEKWDAIEDDTSIVMNVKGKGLVILSGCAHAGIINTIKHLKKQSGIDKVHAVLGGFHLSGDNENIIDPTIEEIKAINPDYVVPMHCTGWKAINRFAEEMPEQFMLNSVGSTFVFQ